MTQTRARELHVSNAQGPREAGTQTRGQSQVCLVTKPKLLNDVKLRPSKRVFKINIRGANKEIQKETGEPKGYQKEKKKELEG